MNGSSDYGPDYLGIILKSLRSDILSRSAIPIVIIRLVESVILMVVSIGILVQIRSFVSTASADSVIELTDIAFLFRYLGILLLGIILFFEMLEVLLGSIVINNAVLSASKEKVKHSLGDALSLIISRLDALIVSFALMWVIYGLLSRLAGIVPAVGGWLRMFVYIAVCLMFFIVYPYVVVDGRNSIDSIVSSFRHFTSHYVQVFVMWIMVAAVKLALLAMLTIPMIILMSPALVQIASDDGAAVSSGMFNELLISHMLSAEMLPYMFLSVMALALGIGISSVLQYGVTARYYYEAVERTNFEQTNE